MFDKKRLIIGLISGALLGVVCIVGAQIRSDFSQETTYLFAFWFNRVLLGLVIGLVTFKLPFKYLLLRGAILGLIVSFSFYATTNFEDIIGFIAGIVYGVIIEYVAYKFKASTE